MGQANRRGSKKTRKALAVIRNERAAMTDSEIYEDCKKVWAEKSGWGWTYDEFISLLGYLEPNEERTLKNGKVVCGSQISYWHSDWMSFSHGWFCAYKHLTEVKNK